MPTATTSTRPVRAAREAVLTGAVDVARAAAEETALPGQVGEHAGFVVEGERLVTHRFDSLVPGYRGWHWAVTLARPPRGRIASVCEVQLLPGDDALLPPPWVPWAERLEPGDVGPNDHLPYQSADPRLEQGFEATGEEDLDRLAIFELGLGRPRVLSPEGRAQALSRWYDGDRGPEAPQARAAKGQCSTCGFFMKMAGTPRTMFGVCANEWSPDDGRVVSVDHGCGAHSETDGPKPVALWNASPPVRDEMDLEVLATGPAEPAVVESAPAATEGAAEAKPETETEAEAQAETQAEPETPAGADAVATPVTLDLPVVRESRTRSADEPAGQESGQQAEVTDLASLEAALDLRLRRETD